MEKLVVHPRHTGDRWGPAAVLAGCFSCRNTFIGLGKCLLRPGFLFASSSGTPQPSMEERPTATVLDRNIPAGGGSFLPSPADLENSQKKVHPLPPPRALEGGDGSSPSSVTAATDRDRTRGIPTDRDRRKAGSLEMRRDTVPTCPKPASSPAIHRQDLDDPEEEEAEEEGEAKQPHGRRLAQSGQRRRRRSRRQAAQTPPADCIGCFQHLHPVLSSSSTTTAFSFFSAGSIFISSSSALHHGSASTGADPRSPLILPPVRCQIHFLTRRLSSWRRGSARISTAPCSLAAGAHVRRVRDPAMAHQLDGQDRLIRWRTWTLLT